VRSGKVWYGMVRSRQHEHNQEASLRRLRTLVPHGAPRGPAADSPERRRLRGACSMLARGSGRRFEVVMAWIQDTSRRGEART
jgi:hypothetical protein